MALQRLSKEDVGTLSNLQLVSMLVSSLALMAPGADVSEEDRETAGANETQVRREILRLLEIARPSK